MDVNQLKDSLVTLATTWGLRLAGVLVAVLLAFTIGGWARRSMLRGFERTKFDPTLARFFSNIARYAILVGAGLGCLGVFGIETASFAAVIAAGGLAVGLAFQGTLSNFAAGVMLLVFRPFKVGDFVSAAGIAGTVREIELFTTELTTPDNRRLIVPNSAIFGSTIENVSYYPTRRVDIPVGTAYDADLEQTRQILNSAVTSVEGVLTEPAHQVFLAGLGASSIDWKLRAWVNSADYWAVHERLIVACKNHLDTAKIGIPFPQVDVHLDPPKK